MTQNNLGNALARLGERESGTARLEEAVAAYRAALEERTRERVPLDWAGRRTISATALSRLGERESGTARLEEAVAAFRAALEERTRERVPLIGRRPLAIRGSPDADRRTAPTRPTIAENALQQIETAYETLRSGGQAPWSAYCESATAQGQAIRDRLKGH